MAEGKLTLNNWTLWMSVDEYTGGSFLYSEWIRVDNTKCFKLWQHIVNTSINKRSSWYAVAMEPVFQRDEDWRDVVWMLWFSADWYMESNWANRWSSPDWEFWWWIYKRASWWYVNWLVVWDQILWISNSKIDRITTMDGLYGSNIVSNPTLTSDTDWTVWTWWTTWTNWATHSTGVNTLRQGLTLTESSKYRITTKVSWVTAWSCEVRLWSETIWTITATTDNWFMWVGNTGVWDTSLNLTFIPTTTFNWTIEYVKVQEYDSAKLLPDNITITDYASHPVCRKWPFIYIGSWSAVDVIDTTTRTKDRTVNIIESDQNIRDITVSWNSIILWTSNWKDSRQYYWNWVDDVADEVIEWNSNNIAWVASDETKNYVITSNNYNRDCYAVSWYQRQNIARSVYNWRTIEWGREPYNINKKYNFKITRTNQAMVLKDTLYVVAYGWIYSYWSEVVGIQPNWNKSIKTLASTTIYALQTMYARLYFSNRISWENFISYAYSPEYCSNWYLVTNTILWDNLSSRKNLTKLKIGFKNIKKDYGNIKVYAIVDDDYFWRYQVTSVTTRPSIWDKYNVWTNTVWEIIAIENNWTTGVITFKTTENTANYPWNYLSSITKVTGSGQATISTGRLFDNMCLLKTIESDYQEYGDDLIFSKNFIDAHMPDRHKLQLVIELNSNNSKVSPEIYDVSILSDIADADV